MEIPPPIDFTIEVTRTNNFSVLKVVGDVDLYTSPTLADFIGKLIESNETHIAVDLSKCSYFDAGGVRIMVEALHQLGQNGRLAICGARGIVDKVFSLCGLYRWILFVSSVEELP